MSASSVHMEIERVVRDRSRGRMAAAFLGGLMTMCVGGNLVLWAVMGMNVFLGLRYGVWTDDLAPEAVADVIADMLVNGLAARP